MKLSLRWKILAWFFVNLALIAAAVWWFLRAQFSVGIHSLIAGPTGVRLDEIGRALSADLRSLPEAQWSAALDRETAEWRARGVKVALFRNDGRFVTGDFRSLPAEVDAALKAHDAKMGGGGPGGPGGPGGAGGPGRFKESEFLVRERPSFPDEFDGFPRRTPPPDKFMGRDPGTPKTRPAQRAAASEPPGGFEKFILPTANPRTYWAGVHLDSAKTGAFPATLFLSSTSIRGGGLFFDFVPWLWLGGAIIVGSALLWLPFVHGLTSSLARLTASAERIAGGNFEPSLETSRGDELGRLQNAHRNMAVRLEGYVAGQKRFLGDTAHELLSPLARLEVAISILEQRTAPEDRGYTERALGEVSHISALVHELLAFSKTTLKAGDTKLEELPLSVVVRECAAREGSLPDIEIPDALCVVASRALLGRAVGNIIRNAIRYAPGPLRISATRHGERVEVSFADEGPGVPADALPKIFDPFFRPDTSRNSETGGVGLGLAIVKTCVEACAGTVVANNREPRGFVVTLSLRTGSA